jgi:hypothetical protein
MMIGMPRRRTWTDIKGLCARAHRPFDRGPEMITRHVRYGSGVKGFSSACAHASRIALPRRGDPDFTKPQWRFAAPGNTNA